ncbi:TfuA-like protein [Sinorhizobium sp. BG8]|uniref:TfuA-like protein n=1 Tax=Sinorhizobium sp. BG8 TaxID=2613773 RepID=UPI00193CEC40|nr:TfuA-like protein [Sinorhizobium sp. BG8]QRM53248.1 hypothetical protein F3Y30_00680 [Sinorhizobium sp. BG8]
MNNRIVVFLGPTLSAGEARSHLDALYLPPVSQGDVARAVIDHAPRAIVIVDGVFAQRPAVRHKEILWAMAAGVRVFGASSMGAIRAAELDECGMVGHGFVYRWYRRTPLADDADVAVPMAPPELGSRALGEALVDIRLTLRKAEREGVIHRELRLGLEEAARALHFTDRTYDRILSGKGLDEADGTALRGLQDWISQGVVHQKKADAISLLSALSKKTGLLDKDQQYQDFELTEALASDLQYSGLLDCVLRHTR